MASLAGLLRGRDCGGRRDLEDEEGPGEEKERGGGSGSYLKNSIVPASWEVSRWEMEEVVTTLLLR